MPAFMLDRAEWLNYIKTSLGYPVVNIYMTDEMIEQQISFTLRKVLPWVNAVEFIQVNEKVTSITDKLIYAVIRVTCPGYIPEDSTTTGTTYYDLLLTKSIYNQLGGSNPSAYSSSSSGLVNAALYNYYAEETRAALDPIGFRLVGDLLMIDGGTPPYTVECITRRSLNNMTEDYQTWCLRYSISLCKQVEARVLRKIKITGSPIEQDGEALMQEGITEQKELEEKLGNQMSLFFCTR